MNEERVRERETEKASSKLLFFLIRSFFLLVILLLLQFICVCVASADDHYSTDLDLIRIKSNEN